MTETTQSQSRDSGYTPDCADCPTPAECRAANDCAVMRQVRHPSRPDAAPLKVRGIGRVKSESGGSKYDDWTLEVYFDRQPTDNEMRQIHDLLAGRTAVSEPGKLAVSRELLQRMRDFMITPEAGACPGDMDANELLALRTAREADDVLSARPSE